MQFRLTNKLSKRIGQRVVGAPNDDISPFLDWACQHIPDDDILITVFGRVTSR